MYSYSPYMWGEGSSGCFKPVALGQVYKLYSLFELVLTIICASSTFFMSL